MTDAETATAIFQKYHDHYEGKLSGAYTVIADEIQKAIGGECVAGQLFWNVPTSSPWSQPPASTRTHWWVEKDGGVYDPMGEFVLSEKDEPKGRREVHRDRGVFEIVLQKFEPWRLRD